MSLLAASVLTVIADDGPIATLVSILETETLWKRRVEPAADQAGSQRSLLVTTCTVPMMLDLRALGRDLDAAVPDRFRPIVECLNDSYAHATPRKEPRLTSYERIVGRLREQIAGAKRADPSVPLRQLAPSIAAARTEAKAILAECDESAQTIWRPLLLEPLRLLDEPAAAH